jgi:predicted DNA-binding protein (UPF0251 family)
VANRWVSPIEPTPPDNADESTARNEGVVPTSAVEAWRTWLLTGNPGVVSDRRRLRGSHRGLKQMLVDGTGQEMPQSWKHFSGAMVRLAINDALNALPKEQTHVVWLAYFGGLSNSEIARRLGISVGAVQRRLKLAFEYVSEQVEHGRSAGRRAVFALVGWLSLRWLGESWRQATESTNHAVMAGALIAAGATAAVLVGATAAPVTRTSIAPAVMASAPAPVTATGAPPSIAGVARSVPDAVTAAVSKVAPGVAVVVPSPPPLPLPKPPPLPLPSPPPLP